MLNIIEKREYNDYNHYIFQPGNFLLNCNEDLQFLPIEVVSAIDFAEHRPFTIKGGPDLWILGHM